MDECSYGGYMSKKLDQKARADAIRNLEERLGVNFSKIEDLYRDRNVVQQSKYTETKTKNDGVSDGYVAVEGETGKTFLLKTFLKTTQHLSAETNLKDIVQQKDAVTELIASTMYEFLLYNRAPKEALVSTEASNPHLHIRSKFFDNVRPLASGLRGQFDYRDQTLKDLEGFEKVVAACNILGEADYHAGNIMVQDNKTMVKIDHGRSFIGLYPDFRSSIRAMYESFKNFGYYSAMAHGNLSFNIDKYASHLNQMVQQLDDTQIDDIIDRQVHSLKRAGMDPHVLFFYKKNPEHGDKHISFHNSFEELASKYKDSVKNHISGMRQIAKTFGIISKFDNMEPQFKNAGWFEHFGKYNSPDPITFAIKHGLTIEGKQPLEWQQLNCTPEEILKWQTDKEVREHSAIVNTIDDFTIKHIKSNKPATEKDIVDLYENILKYYQKHTNTNANIDAGEVKKHAQETLRLLNHSAEIGLLPSESFYISISKFCKKIGLQSLGEFFKHRVGPEKRIKIDQLERTIFSETTSQAIGMLTKNLSTTQSTTDFSSKSSTIPQKQVKPQSRI